MNKLMNWLASGEGNFFQVGDDKEMFRSLYIVSRVQKDESFDYLYCQFSVGIEKEFRNKPFEYAGIYCKKDGQIYDAQQILCNLFGDREFVRNYGKLAIRKRMEQEVREKVESVIKNDRTNLQVSELTDEFLLGQLRITEEGLDKTIAQDIFLKAQKPDFSFKCEYEREYWSDTEMTAYILNPSEYTDKEAKKYLQYGQERMLYVFLHNELVKNAYAALVLDTQNPAHALKKILTVMKNVYKQTVTVTIYKNGQEFVFRTKAAELRRVSTDGYNIKNISASDRRLFQATFGDKASYAPQDILRITYGKKILYEA